MSSPRPPRTGKALKSFRTRRGMSQQALADWLGCSQGRISQLEAEANDELPESFMDLFRAKRTSPKVKRRKAAGRKRNAAPKRVPKTGEGLKALRMALNLNQQKFGDLIGYSQPRVSQLEGEDELPPGVVVALARLGSTEVEQPSRRRGKSYPCNHPHCRPGIWTGGGLRKLLDHLQDAHRTSRRAVASGCGIKKSSLVQYEYLDKLPKRFRAKLQAFLEG